MPASAAAAAAVAVASTVKLYKEKVVQYVYSSGLGMDRISGWSDIRRPVIRTCGTKSDAWSAGIFYPVGYTGYLSDNPNNIRLARPDTGIWLQKFYQLKWQRMTRT